MKDKVFRFPSTPMVGSARRSGPKIQARSAVPTVKDTSPRMTGTHHDGFALWPTATNDWNVASTLYKKDLLKPLAEACKKHGIKLGFYYSHSVDWANGGACNTATPSST